MYFYMFFNFIRYFAFIYILILSHPLNSESQYRGFYVQTTFQKKIFQFIHKSIILFLHILLCTIYRIKYTQFDFRLYPNMVGVLQ